MLLSLEKKDYQVSLVFCFSRLARLACDGCNFLEPRNQYCDHLALHDPGFPWDYAVQNPLGYFLIAALGTLVTTGAWANLLPL